MKFFITDTSFTVPEKKELTEQEFKKYLDNYLAVKITASKKQSVIDKVTDYLKKGQPIRLQNKTFTIEMECKVCGCTNDDACYHELHGPCWWVKDDLCSHCHLFSVEAKQWSEEKLETI